MSSFCLFLYLLHIPPRLILLHNSVPCYIIKSSVDDVCLRLKVNTLHIQDELVTPHNQGITLQN